MGGKRQLLSEYMNNLTILSEPFKGWKTPYYLKNISERNGVVTDFENPYCLQCANKIRDAYMSGKTIPLNEGWPDFEYEEGDLFSVDECDNLEGESTYTCPLCYAELDTTIDSTELCDYFHTYPPHEPHDWYLLNEMIAGVFHYESVEKVERRIASKRAKFTELKEYIELQDVAGKYVPLQTRRDVPVSGKYPRIDVGHNCNGDDEDLWRNDNDGNGRCEGCFDARVMRLCRWVECEIAFGADLFVGHVDDSFDLESLPETKRWVAFPTTNGRVIFGEWKMSQYAMPLAPERREIWQVVHSCADTPRAKIIKKSPKWGGFYK